MKPVRIQRSRQHKQVSPNGLPIVYVGRPTKYGNPFRAGQKGIIQAESVLLYEIIIKKHTEQIKTELAGKNLSCWCKLGEPCHADILLEIANH